MKKRFFTKSIIVLTIIALLLPCIPVIASAEDIDYTATYTLDSSWYDSNKTEFTISTPEQLAYFMYLGTLGTTNETFNGKTIKLGANIVWNDGVATAEGFTPSAEQGNKVYAWTPYAQAQTAASSWNQFRGTFDGQGYTISGLYVNSTKKAAAFIGTGRGCTIKNVTFDNAYVTAYGGTGVNDIAIVLGMYYGSATLTNVHTNGHVVTTSNGTVAQMTQAGSLVGGPRYNSATLSMTNCTASGSVEGRQYTGGLVGSVWANTSTLNTKNLTMTDCINYATVKGETNIGGLVGNLAGAASFTRCASFGSITQTVAAAGSGSLVAIRLNNAGTAVAVPTAFGNCAQVYFNDCFFATNENSSYNFPVYVNVTNYEDTNSSIPLQYGHRIITTYSDYLNDKDTTTYKDFTLFPGHANTIDSETAAAMSAYDLAATIRDQVFCSGLNADVSGYTDTTGIESYGLLQAPAKGTDAVKVEGVQTQKNDTTYAARFISSISLTDMAVEDIADIEAMGFQVAQYKDYGVNGAAAIKEKNCASAYTSIKSNFGADTISADTFGADYIGTLVINGIPAEGIQTLLVRSYYTTKSGATYYSSYVAFSFINGEYAGSAVVSTIASDSDVVSTASVAVDYNTASYDLAALLPDQAEGITVSNDTQDFDGTSVPLSFGLNTFYAHYTEEGNPRTCEITVARRDQYRIVFNSNGGSYIATEYVDANTTLTYSNYIPTRTGFSFNGWFKEDGTQFYMGSTPITENLVLIAKWTDARTSVAAPDYSMIQYATSSAALNINWKDTANAFGERPSVVYCTLTDTDASVSYQVKVTETDATFVSDKPSGAIISQGAGNWTVKITNLTGNYTLTQDDLGNVPYTTLQSGTTVTNTFTENYDPRYDETAALYTANGRFYDYAGNVVVLKGVVTVNVGTVNFAGNTSTASLARLQAEGVNCVRITMQLNDGTSSNIGFLTQSDGTTAQTTERKNELMEMLQTAVNNATDLGMYCIIDWGILGTNPQDYQNAASYFFGTLAETYKDNPYVLFEICNEPKVTDGTWHTTVKPYAEAIIEVIREKGSQAIVIVAPNDYAKRISEHANNTVENGRTDDPIDYPILAHNVAISFHIYAYNHEYENTTNDLNGFGWRMKEAVDAGLTIVMTEFSPAISDIGSQSTGGMEISQHEANKYLNVLLETDGSYFLFRYISHFDSFETSTQHMFVKGNNADLNAGTWTDEQLTDSGKWFLSKAFRNDGFIGAADWTPSTPR